MARRRKGFQGFADLSEVNQTLSRTLRTLPSLEREVVEETEDVLAFENLVVELHTLSSWLGRLGAVTPTELPAVKFRTAGIANSIHAALRMAEAQDLSSGLRVRLAALGKLLLLVSRFRG